ncbi:MAG: GNAT family N-acetyltransferase [Thermoplasmata archaeon]|nr:GNAT family N-acetyltransferase [Thermoplasmata archaeon]
MTLFRPTRVTLRDGRIALIRRARARDAEAVIAHVNAIGAEGVHLMTEKLRHTPEEERAVFRSADGKAGLYLVAVCDGKIVGSADIARGRHSKNRHTAELGLALRKEARGIGLGTAMMRALIEWSRSVGLQKLTLGVFASNAPARALYRKLGFVQEGRLKGQVILRGKPVDELLLALWL